MMKIIKTTVRIADSDDLYPLLEVKRAANSESDYGLDFNDNHAVNYTWQYIMGDSQDIIIAEHEGEIVGGALVAASLEYHDKPFCYMCKFWVPANGEVTDASRRIIEAVIEWAEKKGCSHAFSTATAGLGPKYQQLFINLVKKAGFADVGPVLSLNIGNK